MKNKAFTLIQLLVVSVIIGVMAAALLAGLVQGPFMGTFPLGPERVVSAKVERLYVNSGGKEHSHYMVGTDRGVFEVDNSVWLNIYNADEIYSKLKQDHTYVLITKGNKVANFWMQKYPGIISAMEVQKPSTNDGN